MKFSKIYFLPLIGLLIFVLSACWGGDRDEIEEEKIAKEHKEEIIVGTAQDLLDRDEPLYCQTEHQSESGTVKSVYYFDNQNERMRADLQVFIAEEDASHNISIIAKDGWAYMWDDLMNVDGMKIRSDETDETTQEQLDLEQELEFTCQSWTVDETIFILPADKSFTDMTYVIEQFKEMDLPEFDSSHDWQAMTEEDFADIDFDNLLNW